jgi:DNA-binding transcriptional ArsR family regulator
MFYPFQMSLNRRRAPVSEFMESDAIAPMASGSAEKHGGSMVSTKLIANAEAAAEFLTLMGNEKRLLIMSYLADGEMSVGAIADKVLLSQSALSQHLAKLRALNLVETRRDRQMIYYSCRSEAVSELLQVLDGIFGEGPLSHMAHRLRRAGT